MVRAALFDVDGTLVDGRVWRGILDYPEVRRSRVRLMYARALPHLLRLKVQPAYEARFRDRWVRGLAWLLQGWREQEVEKMADWIAGHFLERKYRQDVLDLVHYHKSEGHPVVLVSTMFPPILEAIARNVGADSVVGTAFETRNGVLTGAISGQSCAGPRKLEFARHYLASNLPGIAVEHCAAYADSYSDIPLLAASAQPCAVNPDLQLRRVCQDMGWRIHSE